ncbi:hypothetical protein OGM63_03725 [Plectonema radiosum NIES-515]|uniref:Uncharacterized protein n=1 Tax=Plectonema radiosum NIES-515 TaxID=2986073 RepID=A0ABT3AU46_9CYAN|nr:hypothetical protein [Plectonema radiosum]MCV3212648.1 hypothetical protein [Plectonema radiosum NIES-515]
MRSHSTIHPYPTLPEAIRKAADKYKYSIACLDSIKKLSSAWLAWRR